MASINYNNQSPFAMNKAELQAEIRTYGAKVSGNTATLSYRVLRLRKREFISTDFPRGKIPANLANPLKKPSNGSDTFNDECCICMDDINSDGISTICHHGFHRKCLKKWLKNDSRCPICRTQVGSTFKKQAVATTYIDGIMGTNSNHLQPHVQQPIIQYASRPQLQRTDTQSREFMNRLLLDSALEQQRIILTRIDQARSLSDHNAMLVYSIDLADVTRRIRRLMQ